MNQNRLCKDIISALEGIGYKTRVVSISYLVKLRVEIVSLKEKLSSIFFDERLTFFQFTLPAELTTTKSIIIVASPQFQIKLNFIYKQEKYSTAVPPTYAHNTDYAAKETIEKLLTPNNYSICDTQLPIKLLAGLAGLVQYGRNNITYIKGMGSFFRLKGFYTDLECEEEPNQELSVMEECENCQACIKICPTKAITKKDFLIDAEKCLTFMNERINDFPNWVDPKWHNCLIGCMKCQFCCPLNLSFRNVIDSEIEFDETETGLIINETPKNLLPEGVIRKLKNINLLDDYNLLSRNLKAILSNPDLRSK